MEPEAVEKIAQGRVWAGVTAKDLGLVDEIGNLHDTIKAAAEYADLKDYEIFYIEQPSTKRWQLMKVINRLIPGIIGFPRSTGHPVQELYATIVDRGIDHIFRVDDPTGLYAFCLNCIEP